MSMRAADVVQSDNIILSSERNVFSTEEYGYSDVLRYKTRRFQGGGRITLVCHNSSQVCDWMISDFRHLNARCHPI